jgi:hypothetical protein
MQKLAENHAAADPEAGPHEWEILFQDAPVPYKDYTKLVDDVPFKQHSRTVPTWTAKEIIPEVVNENIKDDQRLDWIKSHIELDKYEADEHWTNHVAEVAKEFFDDPKQIKIFYWVEQSGLKYSVLNPPILNEDSYDSDFCYFIKLHENEVVTIENIESTMIYNVVQFFALFDLLTMMQNNYITDFFAEKEWSQNVKNEFLKHLREFMVILTSKAWKRKGSTKLYIPIGDTDDLANYPNDNDLQHRIEQLLQYWSN